MDVTKDETGIKMIAVIKEYIQTQVLPCVDSGDKQMQYEAVALTSEIFTKVLGTEEEQARVEGVVEEAFRESPEIQTIDNSLEELKRKIAKTITWQNKMLTGADIQE